MDGPSNKGDWVHRVARVGEPTRLRTPWLSLAYERLCPIRRMRTGSRRAQDSNLSQQNELPSKMTAGGRP